MKLLTSYSVRVTATGFVVLILLSITLFWLGSLCRLSVSVTMPVGIREQYIEPSGYVSRESDEDPNVIRRSRVSAGMRPELALFWSLGIYDYLESRRPGGSRSNVFFAESQDTWAYFDEPSGRIICRYNDTETMPDRNRLYRQVQYYIGPEGISEIPDESVGRFVEPIIDRNWLNWRSRHGEPQDLILYDRGLRNFFKIDFDKATITRGPAVGDDQAREPVQIGILDKNTPLLHLNWLPVRIKSPNDGKMRQYGSRSRSREQSSEPIRSLQYHDASRHLLVLDKSGRIDLLDKETLRFVGNAGRLPQPKTLFGLERLAKPKNILSYSAGPLYLEERFRPRDSQSNAGQKRDPNALAYAGMFAASLSRDGTSLVLAAFDDEGKLMRSMSGGLSSRRSGAEDAYFGSPGAPLASLGKFVTESLHPPVLSIASCFTASAFEAGAGHTALFLPPDSFVAINARDNRGGIWVKIVIALLLLTPSILLAAWLACRVTSDAATVGLPGNLRRLWTLLTLAFGLAGYITYRLMRPTITLVTCPNCGKGRRPDMETCHQCNSKWQVPELVPPTWRVLQS